MVLQALVKPYYLVREEPDSVLRNSKVHLPWSSGTVTDRADETDTLLVDHNQKKEVLKLDDILNKTLVKKYTECKALAVQL